MASCQPRSQSEDQSPELASSGYPLEVIVNEIPGPSGEEVEGRRGVRGLTRKEQGVQKSGRSV